MSIGLTRIFAKLLNEGMLAIGPRCPSQVLVVIPNDRRRAEAARTAALLGRRGFKVELYHRADRLAKQVRYASRKGIPFVWFPPFADGQLHEVKDMATGEQREVDPASWPGRVRGVRACPLAEF